MMVDETELLDEETLLAKHRKEKKELQCKIQALKKSATKGDKKKKKEVSEEIAALEFELEKKHSYELDNLKQKTKVDTVSGDLQKLQFKDTEEEKEVEIEGNEDNDTPQLQKRVSKAQKRREKKVTKEKEREKLIAIQEVENKHGARNVETQKIKEILRSRKLILHEIASDGNCLYCAVDYALGTVRGEEFGYKNLRKMTSEYLRKNFTDYLPFTSDPATGDMLSQEQYEAYCDQIANTSSWGGQVELRALSHILKCPIEVIQAVGPAIVIGEEYKDQKSLILTYHRHMYSLGEHYNAVKPYENEQQDDI